MGPFGLSTHAGASQSPTAAPHLRVGYACPGLNKCLYFNIEQTVLKASPTGQGHCLSGLHPQGPQTDGTPRPHISSRLWVTEGTDCSPPPSGSQTSCEQDEVRGPGGGLFPLLLIGTVGCEPTPSSSNTMSAKCHLT